MLHLVMYSAGGGSWMTARRVAERHGTADLRLLFTDTLYEAPDTYVFLAMSAARIFGIALPPGAVPSVSDFPPFREREAYKAYLVALRERISPLIPGLVWIADGRDIWDVFRAERFLGNSSIDPCSKILKRQLADRWMRENCSKEDTRVYVGIDWSEAHRFDDGEGRGVRPRREKDGWTYEAPLTQPPFVMKPEIIEAMKDNGLPVPMAYTLGFGHNNCFSGDTRFVTDRGVRTLRAMAGRETLVVGAAGRLTPASVRSFGIQPLLALRLARGSERRTVHVTAGHRWFVMRDGLRAETVTSDLVHGDALASMRARSAMPVPVPAEGLLGRMADIVLARTPLALATSSVKAPSPGRVPSPSATSGDWTVVDVVPTGRTEEVFCAVVPDGEAFTLDGDLLTGNCRNFCIKAGHEHYRNMILKDRDHYLYIEEEEESLRKFLDADVSVLTDRAGDGKKKVLTLREFRRRIEEAPQMGFMFIEEYAPIKLGEGGCGCMLESDEDDWTRALDERLAELVRQLGLGDNAVKAIAAELGIDAAKVDQRVRTLGLAPGDALVAAE